MSLPAKDIFLWLRGTCLFAQILHHSKQAVLRVLVPRRLPWDMHASKSRWKGGQRTKRFTCTNTQSPYKSMQSFCFVSPVDSKGMLRLWISSKGKRRQVGLDEVVVHCSAQSVAQASAAFPKARLRLFWTVFDIFNTSLRRSLIPRSLTVSKDRKKSIAIRIGKILRAFIKPIGTHQTARCCMEMRYY